MTTFLEIGILIKAHGLEGLARVKLYSSGELLQHVDRVRLVLPDGTTQDRAVTAVTAGPRGQSLLRLGGVNDRSAVEALCGAQVLVFREDLPALAADEVYLVDTVGCEVRLPDGTVIGRVESIGDNGAQPLFVIRQDESLFNVPAVPPLLQDFDGKVVTVDLPDGLLDAVRETLPSGS